MRAMITFTKKTDAPAPASDETEENRFERIRKAAAEKHKKSSVDGASRGSRPTAEDKRLI